MAKRQTPGPRDLRIGRHLANLRKAMGKSQKDVAAVAGVSWQQISKYENGKDCISASCLEVISEYLLGSAATGFEEPQARYLAPHAELHLYGRLEEGLQRIMAEVERLRGEIKKGHA